MVIPVTKAPPPPVEELLFNKMGIKGQTVTPALATKFKLTVNQGVYIDTVQPDSPAAKCGLQVGDVFFQLGRYYVNSPEDVATLLKTVTQPLEARVGIVRGNRARGGDGFAEVGNSMTGPGPLTVPSCKSFLCSPHTADHNLHDRAPSARTYEVAYVEEGKRKHGASQI